MFVDVFTDILKLTSNLQIRIPQFLKSHVLQILSSLFIVCFLFFFKMTGAVKLNHRFCLCTIEINDISADRLLTLEP